MEVFLIAAITADGFISEKKEEGAFWTSKEDKKRFVSLTKDAGVIIMGRTTFETIGQPLKNRLNIVYSNNNDKIEGAEITKKDPKKLIEDLKKRGFKKVAICGGSSIYSLFVKSDMIDKVYLTIEPKFFGTGLTLFNEKNKKELILEEVIKENQSVFLKYKLKK